MTATTKPTLDEFLSLEETKPYREYVCGEVTQKPMPNWDHSAIQAFLAAILFPFLAQAGSGRVLTEFRCIFGGRAYVPDLSYVAKERLTGDRYLRSAPDLAIEVLSPDQDMGRFLEKIQAYLRYGVRLVWVIDPVRATVTVLMPGEDARVLTAGDVLDGGDVLPGFTLAIDEIFAQTRV